MAGVAMGLESAVSFVNGIIGYQNGMAQAKAADINADITEYNADATRFKSVQEQDRILSRGKQDISKQFVAALQGGSIGGGTSENAIAKSVYNLKTDLVNTAYNYENEAIGFLNESKLNRYYSKVYKGNAGTALAGGVLGAAATVLGGVGGSSSKAVSDTGTKALQTGLNSSSKLSLFGA